MDEEKYQKELFEFEKPKRFFPKLSDFFPKGDFERNVVLTLTLDRAVFIAIGIIMVMVVLYALGVESGKFQTTDKIRPVPAPVILPQAVKVAVPVAKIQVALKAPVAKQQIMAKVPVKPVLVPVVSSGSKPYTIVAATFVNKDIAIQEILKLKRLGYNAVLVQSDHYFKVCIGAYADKVGAESQKDLKKVKRLYKDAYLKLK